MNKSFCVGVLSALGLASCGLSASLLIPRSEWLVEPSELGYEFEDVVLKTGPNTSVHGWFLPNEASAGRTVLFCHGNAANISFYHPYYSFLHDAGWNVFLFDYRGYGKSEGAVSVRSIFTDAEGALAYLKTRPDVAPEQIVVFGTSLGSIVALRTAARHPELAGVIVEDATSPREYISRGIGPFLAGVAALIVLPNSIEPVYNAARTNLPALFLCGEWDPALRPHLDAAAAHGGSVANWVQPGTAHAPSGLLEHDLEYQAGVARFLDACIDGRCPRVEVTALESGELELRRFDLAGEGPLAVELCLVDETGNARFTQHWLKGASLRVRADAPFRFATAWPYTRIERDENSGLWARKRGPFALSADAVQTLKPIANLIRESLAPTEEARIFSGVLAGFEQENGPLALQARTELMPELLLAGETLWSSTKESDRELGKALLEHCVAAEPPVHGGHYWPGSPYHVNFVYQAELDRARALLESSEAANE